MSDPRKCNFVTTFGFNERLSSYAENPVNFLLKPLISRFLINRLKKIRSRTEICQISRMPVDENISKTSKKVIVPSKVLHIC